MVRPILILQPAVNLISSVFPEEEMRALRAALLREFKA